MIAKLTGRVDSIADGSAVIDAGGVGYLVFCSARTLARLTEGTTASLLVDTHLREDGIFLYGFADSAERQWFRMLIGVQGVGPKVALAILGVAAADDLARAIGAGDKALLTQASGVGAKLAARIAGELKERAAALRGPVVPVRPGVPVTGETAAGETIAADAISALVNLGFRPLEAQGAVAVVLDRLGPAAPLEAVIRGGLSELAGKEHRL